MIPCLRPRTAIMDEQGRQRERAGLSRKGVMSGTTALSVRRLAEAIGYPESLTSEEGGCMLRVDGHAIRAVAVPGRVMLRYALACPEERLREFAEYAAGRVLREDAVLAWDSRASELFLWIDIPEDADAETVRRAFEGFADACDWWSARAAETEVPTTAFPDILIRP